MRKQTIILALSIISMLNACKPKQKLQEMTAVEEETFQDIQLASPKADALSYPECCKISETNYAEFNTEQYDYQQENGFKTAKENPLSTFSIDVDRASYSNIRRILNSGKLPPKGAVRIEEMINYFTYNYPKPVEQPFSITTEYGSCPWNKEHQIVLIGLQGKAYEEEITPPYNLTFLIDVSGSMEAADKLPLVKKALKLLTARMRVKDCISIVVYAGNAGLVLAPTYGTEKDKIYNAIDELSSGGSTAGGEGIKLAYKTANLNFSKSKINRVILATDGDFNVGVSSDDELVGLIEKERATGIFLTVLGFGSGNYKDSKMEKLADKGNGNYAYIDNEQEAKKVLITEIGGTLQTIAKDVKIQVEFNPENVKAYRLIGYENRVLNNEDFNDDTKDAGELGAGHCVTALYEIIPAGSTEQVPQSDPLKYQQATIQASKLNEHELLTVKFRFKKPDSDEKSILMQQIVHTSKLNKTTSANFLWATTVASFGMLLSHSDYAGILSYNSLKSYLKQINIADLDENKLEMINLIEKAEQLGKND